MKRILYILPLLILTSCFEDNSQVITSEDIGHRSSELTTIVKSMSLHNASFDDHIDNTSCFSLVFPYQLHVNSDPITINSIEDILDLSEDDDIEIIYPVETIFFNYDEHQVTNTTELNLAKNLCQQDFDLTSNPCLDFEFPITLKKYNELTGSFDTFHFYNDKEIFIHFDNFHDQDVYEIDYPVTLFDSDSNPVSISSNLEFIDIYNLSLQNCE